MLLYDIAFGCSVCIVSSLSWALLSRRARNYCPDPHYCHFFLSFRYQLQSEVEKPLLNFRENFKKDMKKCDHHIADLRKHLASRYAAVEKVRTENKLESLWDTAGLNRKAAALWKVFVLPWRTTKVFAVSYALLGPRCRLLRFGKLEAIGRANTLLLNWLFGSSLPSQFGTTYFQHTSWK